MPRSGPRWVCGMPPPPPPLSADRRPSPPAEARPLACSISYRLSAGVAVASDRYSYIARLLVKSGMVRCWSRKNSHGTTAKRNAECGLPKWQQHLAQLRAVQKG